MIIKKLALTKVRSKTLNRYLYVSTIGPITLGIFIATFILIIDRLSELIEPIVIKKIPFLEVFELFSYHIVSIFNLTIPIGVFIGCMLAYGNMALSNELIALRALGIGIRRYIKPSLTIGALFSLFLLFMNEKLIPLATKNRGLLENRIAQKRPTINLKEKQFIDIDAYSIYLNEFDQGTGVSGSFVLFQRERGHNYPMVVVGKSLKSANESMYLEKSSAHRINDYGKEEASFVFNIRKIPIPNFIKVDSDEDKNENKALSVLSKRIKELESSKTEDVYELRILKALYHQKLAFSFAPFVFAFLAVVLSSGASVRLGRGTNIAISLLIIFLYWVWTMSGKAFIVNIGLNAAMVLWAPNIVLLFISMIIFLKRSRH